MKQIKQVVVGADGSPACRAALREAARIAGGHGARLHVVQVVTADVVEHFREAWVVPMDEILAEIRGGLQNFVKTHVGGEVDLRLQVIVGHPYLEIAGVVEDVAADLLVLGAQGWNEDARKAGLIAKKCIRHVGCPVLLVRRDHEKAYRRIAVGIDFSETSGKALAAAADLACHEGAPLDVVHVHYPPWLSPVSVDYTLRQTVSPDYRHQYLALLEDRMRSFVEPARRANPSLDVRTHVIEHTNAVYGMTQFFHDAGTDLAVVGTHGASGIRATLLGTTAERILHTSPCSVLMVKPSSPAAAGDGA